MVDLKIGQRLNLQSHARGDAIAVCERERGWFFRLVRHQPIGQLAMQSYHILNCASPLAKRNNDVEDIIICPNPSSTGFTFTNMPLNWKLEVNNMIGITIFEKEGSGNSSIPSGILPKGIYAAVITILTTNEQITKKLLVQ